MRLRKSQFEGFNGGIVVGLAAAAVAFIAVGATRRVLRLRRDASARLAEHSVTVDGVNPVGAIALAVQPMPEGNAFPRRLESERPDPNPLSQRW